MEYQNVEEFAKKLEIKVEDQSHNQVIKIITNERDTTYHCNICDKKFANPNYFRKHSALHLSGEPFQCTICGKGFKKNEYLKQHALAHSENRPYDCENCAKISKQFNN